MQISPDDDMMATFDRWADHFGWRDGKIDLSITDLSSFATHDCVLTVHAPLWGTKPGAERAIPIAEVRTRVGRILRIGRAARHQMHLALHPDGDALGIFVRMKMRVVGLPFTMRTASTAFLVQAVKTDAGLRVHHVHEWAAAGPDEAGRLLIDEHGWPDDTTLHPQVAFGAAS